jgi:hypothetical protein
VTAFDPAIAEDVVREAALVASYTALTGSARIEIEGKAVNLSSLAPYLQHPDRAIRHEAARLRWSFFEENRAELDRSFGELVALRDGMARKLGYESFVDLGYRNAPRGMLAPHYSAAPVRTRSSPSGASSEGCSPVAWGGLREEGASSHAGRPGGASRRRPRNSSAAAISFQRLRAA